MNLTEIMEGARGFFTLDSQVATEAGVRRARIDDTTPVLALVTWLFGFLIPALFFLIFAYIKIEYHIA